MASFLPSFTLLSLTLLFLSLSSLFTTFLLVSFDLAVSVRSQVKVSDTGTYSLCLIMTIPSARVVCPFASSLVNKAVSSATICPSFLASPQLQSKSVQPFESIPSAKGLPILGTSFDLIKSGGASQLHNYCDQRHKNLGNIYREKMGNLDCVFVADASLMQFIYSREGLYPVHAIPGKSEIAYEPT